MEIRTFSSPGQDSISLCFDADVLANQGIKKRTGYGAHGDYLFGWKGDSLQRAMDTLGKNCWSEYCPELKLQSWEAANACTKSQQAKEDIGTDTCMFFFFSLSLSLAHSFSCLPLFPVV